MSFLLRRCKQALQSRGRRSVVSGCPSLMSGRPEAPSPFHRRVFVEQLEPRLALAVIVQPVDATTTLSSINPIIHSINQDGLDSLYTSAVTNFGSSVGSVRRYLSRPMCRC